MYPRRVSGAISVFLSDGRDVSPMAFDAEWCCLSLPPWAGPGVVFGEFIRPSPLFLHEEEPLIIQGAQG